MAPETKSLCIVAGVNAPELTALQERARLRAAARAGGADRLRGHIVCDGLVRPDGSSLDVEVNDSIPRAQVISSVTGVLRAFGSEHAADMRLSDTSERTDVTDVE